MVGHVIPMTGGALPVYAGVQRQMGGNLFSTIKRFALPLLKKLLPHLYKAGQSVARIGSGVVTDLVTGDGKNIKENLKRRGKEEINKLGRDYLDQDIIQSGSGKRKRKRAKAINKKRNTKNKSPKKRKIDPITYLAVRKHNAFKQH